MSMLAYVLESYGDANHAVMRQQPAPEPGAGEILVQVRAVGLNPVDFKIRQGKPRAVLKSRLPIVMGNELAGEVVGVGANAAKFAIGDRVYARVAKGRLGAFAELACVDEKDAARMPLSLDFSSAAAVPLAGLTALQVLRNELRVKSGQKVFISGGAGGVGTFAIQLAKWLGADVTTTASPRGEALVRSLGADRVVDYTSQAFQDVLQGFDSGFDLIGGDTLDKMFSIVKRGGKVVSVAGVPEPQMALKDLGGRRLLAVALWFMSFRIRAMARRAGVAYRYLFMRPSGDDLALLADLIDQGKLKVIVDKTFPFAEIADAMAYLEGGRAKGKVVARLP
jgi:NADPH:quinone reductase-like Zn-dependent oxidoreductase